MTHGNASSDLGTRLREGDEDVLEAILRTHGPPILALLRQRFVGRLVATDIEDVLAAALFRVWQHRTRFDPALASLRVWLFRIAENIARDVQKLGWHKARQLELRWEPAQLAMAVDCRTMNHDVHDDGDDAVDGEMRGRVTTLRIPPDALREMLALLPDNQRRIVLADADSPDGLVASQHLAEELGIPPSTVRVYRRRALERLRRAIEQRELNTQPSDSEVAS